MTMQKILQLNIVFSLVLLVTGCATSPKTLTTEAAARVRTVVVLDEINTPTSFSEAAPAGMGVLVVAIAQSIAKDQLTAAIEQNIDFRQFARDTLKASFIAAVKRHPGWTCVDLNDLAKADAAFVLDITNMGISEPRFFQRFPPTITFSATLIANPPFDVARSGREVQAMDPVKSPTLYRRQERVRDGVFFTEKGLPDYKYYEYTGDPEAFKAAFQAAIDLGVKRLEASWQDGRATK